MPQTETLIRLTQNQFAVVDEADYAWLSQWRWNYAPAGYAQAYIAKEGRSRLIFMHIFLLNPPTGKEVDHIDRNGLNNTRSNLRICTRAQNTHNRGPQRNSSSVYKGVSLDRYGKWRATLESNDKSIWLGRYDSEAAAARAYDAKAYELYGEFAYLNFPSERT